MGYVKYFEDHSASFEAWVLLKLNELKYLNSFLSFERNEMIEKAENEEINQQVQSNQSESSFKIKFFHLPLKFDFDFES